MGLTLESGICGLFGLKTFHKNFEFSIFWSSSETSYESLNFEKDILHTKYSSNIITMKKSY